jgi:hypothetical protein
MSTQFIRVTIVTKAHPSSREALVAAAEPAEFGSDFAVPVKGKKTLIHYHANQTMP